MFVRLFSLRWDAFVKFPLLLRRRSPGFGITVWAETMNGSVYLAETCSNPRTANKKDFTPSVPEDLGKEAAHLLLEEICRVMFFKNV